MNPPLSSHALIARAHRVTAAFHAKVRSAVASLPGNPGLVAVERLGPVWATACRLPGAAPWMNLVAPLGPEEGDLLPQLLAWYGERRPEIQVTPQEGHARLARTLAQSGAVQTKFVDILHGPAVPGAAAAHAPAPAAEVAPVGRDDAALVARTLLDGHGGDLGAHEVEGIASLVGADGVQFWLARLGGEPAAAAILSVDPADDGIGYLATASTLPAHRGRGCHRALLEARLAAATQAGCEMVVALAEVGSTSHRNMERAGLRTLVTVGIWSFREPLADPAV